MVGNSNRDSEFPARKSPIHCTRRVQYGRREHGNPGYYVMNTGHENHKQADPHPCKIKRRGIFILKFCVVSIGK